MKDYFLNNKLDNEKITNVKDNP